MNRLLPACGILTLFIACSTDIITSDREVYCVTARILEPDGKKPACGAIVQLFNVESLDGKPALVALTDENGLYSIEKPAAGVYTLWAEKESLVLRRDSLRIPSIAATLPDDTLDYPSSLTGSVCVEPYHDPRIVTIRVANLDNRCARADKEGNFVLTGLASGTWRLLLTADAPGYEPTPVAVSLGHGANDTISHPLRLCYSGIPIVEGKTILQDTLSGAIMLSWHSTPYARFLDYVLYRAFGGDLCFPDEPFHATTDTSFIDSTYCRVAADPLDTAERPIRYRVAVRDSMRKTGPGYGYAEMTFVPKAAVTTFFTHGVWHAALPCDSASIGDTVVVRAAAWNKTRRLRALLWLDPVTGDTVAKRSPDDSCAHALADTIRHVFGSPGTKTLHAVIIDNAGMKWTDTVPVRIVADAPVANAGGDVEAYAGDTIRLHGGAAQSFGEITGWEWKIGEGSWNRTVGPDSAVIAPADKRTVVCSLAVIDDDGNRGVDDMTIFVVPEVREMAAGQNHSLILKRDGTLFACGNNEFGQLGDGTTKTRLSPFTLMTEVRSVSAGDGHSLILKTDKSLWACGSNTFGQIGDGTRVRRYIPVYVTDDVSAVAAGGSFSLFLKTGGTLWSCGNGVFGQLCDRTTKEYRESPAAVMADVRSIAAGFDRSLVLTSGGTLWTSGYYSNDRPGDSSSWLAQVMIDVQCMVAGYNHCMMLASDGTLWAYGENDFGQLADGTKEERFWPVAVMTNVRSMAAGGRFSLILKNDGTLWACGKNDCGQLGDGTTIDRAMPARVMDNVQGVAAGYRHSLILKTDGTLWACGKNDNGQLGDGTREDRPTPVRIVPRTLLTNR